MMVNKNDKWASCNDKVDLFSIIKRFNFSKEITDIIQDKMDEYYTNTDKYFTGGFICEAVMQEQYLADMPVDLFYMLLVLLKNIKDIPIEDHEGFKNEIEIIETVMNEEESFSRDTVFVIETGKQFIKMREAIKYLTDNEVELSEREVGDFYIIEKKYINTNKTICKFWYDKEFRLCYYDWIKYNEQYINGK